MFKKRLTADRLNQIQHFVFKKACDLLTYMKIKGLWDIIVNKFILVAELSMKTLILATN